MCSFDCSSYMQVPITTNNDAHSRYVSPFLEKHYAGFGPSCAAHRHRSSCAAKKYESHQFPGELETTTALMECGDLSPLSSWRPDQSGDKSPQSKVLHERPTAPGVLRRPLLSESQSPNGSK